MRCLVTGAKGMLGTALCARLREKDHEAVGWDLPAHDVTDIESSINGIHQVGPDVIFHLAAWTDVDGCEGDPARAASVNFQGTWAMALGAAETGAKLLYISSDYVFDGKKDRPYREKDEPAPLSVYGRSKLMGEKAVQRTCKRWFTVRTSWLYGRHGRNFVDTIRKKAEAGEPLRVVDDQVGSPTRAEDLCDPLLTIAESRRFGTYHVANAGQCSWFELAREVVTLSGGKSTVEPADTATIARPAPRPAFSALDTRLVRRKFGIRMRPWQEAVRDHLGVPAAEAGS